MLKWSLGGMPGVPGPTAAHVPLNMQKCGTHASAECVPSSEAAVSRRSLLLAATSRGGGKFAAQYMTRLPDRSHCATGHP